MIREKITYKDYFRVAKENEFFLWHFLQKDQNQGQHTISSILDGEKETNQLPLILDNIDIPYFESYTEESLEFLAGLGFKYENLYQNKNTNVLTKFKFSPIMIGFKKFTKVSSTFEYCYCSEGIVSVLNDLHPKFIEQLNNNLQ